MHKQIQTIIKFRNDILFKVGICIVLVTIIGTIFSKFAIVKGFFLGAAVSALLFFIKTKKIIKKLNSENFRLVRSTVFDFLIRYILMFSALATAYTKPNINFIAAVIGIFILQIVIVFNELILNKIKFMKGPSNSE